jgi:general secretion pathway protein I
MRCDRSGEHGFTMIEALVALALVAVMLTAIESLVASTARGTRSLEQHVALVETARLIGTSLPSRKELAAGELDGELLAHRWRADVSPYFGGGSAPIEGSPWIPQTVLLRVQAPSGAILTVASVRLQKRTAQ